MSGQLELLTPISSPMATRPASPEPMSAVKQPSIKLEPSLAGILAASAAAETSLPATATMAPDGEAAHCSAALGSPGSSSNNSSSPRFSSGAQVSIWSPVKPKIWKSPPCCDGCGAAKASGGQCSGCGGRFCSACMVSPPAAAAAAAGSLQCAGSSNGSPSSARTHAVSDMCSNCSTLCNSCKPVACCFCEELRQQPSSSRLCEACAGSCDACQRAACGLCRAEFSSCSSCGFAACEDCRMQLQLQCGGSGAGGVGSLVGPSGAVSCWCAPPLRMASNVRHVSSQRYQMAQLHPSILARTMEAAGLRDADYDDEDDDIMSYDDVVDDMGHMITSSDLDLQDPHSGSGPGAASSMTNQAQRMTNPQGYVSNYPGLLLSSKSLEAAIGSLTNQGLVSHLSVPLSPSGSTHSSAGHYGAGSALGHGLAGVLGKHVGPLRHPEHSLRGWLDA